jgi:hypothetical protein
MDAPLPGGTAITGAGIGIVALCERTRLAHAAETVVANSTRVAIVTKLLVWDKLAANLRIARIIGARIAVTTHQCFGALALSDLTLVVIGTQVAIITWNFVQQVYATVYGITRVVGT